MCSHKLKILKTYQTRFFCSVPCVLPKSWDLGALGPGWGGGGGGGRGSIFFPKHNHVAYRIEGDVE